jgi:hypothetical protein
MTRSAANRAKAEGSPPVCRSRSDGLLTGWLGKGSLACRSEPARDLRSSPQPPVRVGRTDRMLESTSGKC